MWKSLIIPYNIRYNVRFVFAVIQKPFWGEGQVRKRDSALADKEMSRADAYDIGCRPEY